jgi:hypothetical protein
MIEPGGAIATGAYHASCAPPLADRSALTQLVSWRPMGAESISRNAGTPFFTRLKRGRGLNVSARLPSAKSGRCASVVHASGGGGTLVRLKMP